MINSPSNIGVYQLNYIKTDRKQTEITELMRNGSNCS